MSESQLRHCPISPKSSRSLLKVSIWINSHSKRSRLPKFKPIVRNALVVQVMTKVMSIKRWKIQSWQTVVAQGGKQRTGELTHLRILFQVQWRMRSFLVSESFFRRRFSHSSRWRTSNVMVHDLPRLGTADQFEVSSQFQYANVLIIRKKNRITHANRTRYQSPRMHYRRLFWRSAGARRIVKFQFMTEQHFT